MGLLHTVPLVNSDQLDKLEFVALQSFAFRTCSNGLVRLPRRVLSEPGGPPVGDPSLTACVVLGNSATSFPVTLADIEISPFSGFAVGFDCRLSGEICSVNYSNL